MASRSRSRSCTRGVKKNGACKRKPGPKQSRSRSRSVARRVKRSRSRSRKGKSRSRSRKGKSRSRSRKGKSRSRSRKGKSRSRSRSKKTKGGNIYCVKCRKRTVTNDLSDTCVAGKGGHSRNAETGICALCGGKKMRFKKGNC